MNIHISEKDYNELLKTAIVKITVGSHLYGLDNKDSDKDIMYICSNFSNNLHSFVKHHHQYQYKDIENNTDHLFVDIQTFMNNLLKGDSTINFEALYSNEIKNSDLSFLYASRFLFYNYQLIKSYLGMAKRDIKLYKKDKTNKKMFHIIRGYETALTLFNKQEYSNDLTKNILLYNLKNNLETVSNNYVIEIENKIADLRTQLNQKLEKKEIERIINNRDLESLDSMIIYISKKYSVDGRFINKDYYSAYQADIKYD